jgi:hypothetical protein
LPRLLETNSAEFTLSSQQDVVAWVGQLALDADFTQILSEQSTPSGKLVFTDLADGQYYLKLRAQDRHGLQSLDAIHAFKVKVRLPEPPEPLLELIEPLDGAVIPLAPTNLSWTPMPEATSYIIQIARDVNFENKIFERVVSFNRLAIHQSFGNGEYYWRVAVLSETKQQKFSMIGKFHIKNESCLFYIQNLKCAF